MPIGGYSYQPGAQAMPQQGGSPRALSPQEAVRILSLRLPKHPQNSPVPAALLNSAGGGGSPDLTALLRALMQARSDGGGQGTREMVSDADVPAIDHGYNPTPRRFDPPRVVIGDGGTRQPVDEPPAPTAPVMDDAPLFDAGIPPVRNLMPRKPFHAMGEPLF